ncbi:MAG: FAD-dependent oxidoreductase [Mogibacterium sp.]|nr:FAD-dependent oxidoreductase [Mogibacterium sp.]
MAFRKSIMKMVTKVSVESGTYLGIKPTDSEYMICDPIVTDEMAEVFMGLKLRTPRTAEEVAKRVKKPVDYCTEQLEELVRVGIVRTDIEGDIVRYFFPIWVPGIMEGILANEEQCNKYPVLGECFERYTRERTAALAPNLPVGQGLMRVMPVEESIQNSDRVATFDELSYLIENAEYISVGACSCRRSRRLMGDGCGHLEKDMCMYLNRSAKSMSDAGHHRLISKEEAYEILKRAEDNGLVHEINNVEKAGDAEAICNCCGCSCFSLRIAEYFKCPDLIRSNYVSEVDPEKCVACGQCVENCQVNALRLGQKLCTVEPLPEAPKEAMPQNTPWMFNSKQWATDYRTARKEVVDTGSAPCKMSCPAHLPVQGYIKLAAQGKYGEALELIKKNNPFPAICGRVCNRRCEDACSRGCLDEPIAIDEVKKFIAEQDMKAEHRYVPPMINQIGKPYPEKIAIIGSGPAGLTCAYYLACKGYTPTVFEKEEKLGGMMTLGIPNFRLEKDVVKSEIEVLKELGVEFKTGVEVGKDITIAQLKEQGYKGFYVAIGLQGTRKLGISGEDAEGVLSGLDFIKSVNRGDDVKLAGNVVVIGGGNIAADIARTAVRCGAKNVDMYCLEGYENMPMGVEDREECEAEGIKIHAGWGPSEFTVKDGKLTGVKFKECFSLKDGSGKFNPAYNDNTCSADADYVLVCVGQCADMGNVLDGTKCVVGKGNLVEADGFTWQTADPDVFAGGDIVTGMKFCIDAIAEGKEAAISLHRHVHEGQNLYYGRPTGEYKPLDKDNADLSSYDRAPRQKPGVKKGKKTSTMNDLREVFTEDQLKKETDRCLGCGATVVDTNMCLGCGICTTKCKFDAISLKKVHNEGSLGYEKIIPGVMGKTLAKRAGNIVVKPFKKN